ncbi:MAG: coniferyl-alcohol dehydrogenase [Deltaproteobacteria bacterium]|nr:coniferyl-alcohol dehydrogenase [Deltaproteobacteria bacterium]MBW2361145.1 coniferyl-alcohol dehydrogenase [Deltaproteobacteria bacterium]
MSHPFDYSGKRVVITGAFSGVGAACLEVLQQLGAAEVIALDIKRPDGPISSFIETNMGDAAAVAAAAEQIDGRVDVLFNNAGISATRPVADVMSVNWLGLRQLSEALLPQIPQGGAIVNTASIAGGQWPGHLAEVMEAIAIEDRAELLAWCDSHKDLVGDGYGFSKECVQVYTLKSAKQTLARGVRTNSVCPAPIDTPLLPEFNETMTEKTMSWTIEQCGGTIATPTDIATTLVFLGADAARYVNGVNLNVDMGFSAFMTTGQIDFSGLA